MCKDLVDPPKMLVPGEKLCRDCPINLKGIQPPAQGSGSSLITPASTNDPAQESCGETSSSPSNKKIMDLNLTLSSLGESPVKLHTLKISSKRSKGQQKLASVSATLKCSLESAYVSTKNTETDSKPSDLSGLS